MTAHFRQSGFHVEYAMTAEEVAADESYDVVLMDVHLPGASGVDLARRIRHAQPHQPVIFVTGDADARIAGEAHATGAAAFLLKPFELAELESVIKAVINQIGAACY
jgi:DNA-binding response OmpR family regulator